MGEKTARDKWFETHPVSATDRPSVRVWYPKEAPWSRLQTITVGGIHGEEALPTGPVHANLYLAGVEIGGTLDDLELLVAIAAEELARSRRYANELQAGSVPLTEGGEQ